MMNKSMPGRLALVAGLSLMGVSNVQAQGFDLSRLFVSVNVGGQVHSHTLTTNQAFTVYAETATVTSGVPVSGGFLADFGVGYQIMNNLAVAVSGSRVAETHDATVVGLVPDPVVFNRPRTTTLTVPGLARQEVGVHVQVMWFLPVPAFLSGTRLAFTAGPSFFTVRQDLVTSSEVPAGTQDLTAGVTRETVSSVGVNAGFDARYPLTSMFAIGGFLRYAGSTFDLPSFPNDKSGGFQAAGGVRVNF
jgi:hypothetical protein